VDRSDEATLTLAERIRRGDPAAEEQLVAAYGPRIYAMAVVRTRDREASHDLVQDVLWAVIQALRQGQLRDHDRLSAFVCGTARNLINNYRRTQARLSRDAPRQDSRPGSDFGWMQDHEERVRLVRQAVARLDAADRQVILLTLIAGLKPAEIAARLGLGTDVVRQRKLRAIRKVIEILAKRSRT